MNRQERSRNMGILLGNIDPMSLTSDTALTNDYFSGSALRSGMPDSARGLPQYLDYQAPPERDFEWPDLSALAPGDLTEFMFNTMVKPQLSAGQYAQHRAENPSSILYDIFDASMESYLSDEQRAALPFGDPRRDAISSLAIGVGEAGAGAAVKYGPAVGRQALGSAPEMINRLNRQLGMPELPFEKNIIAGERQMGGFEKEMLDIATEMENQGFNRDRIFQATGLWRGIDDMWRFEISDDLARLKETPDSLEYIADVQGRAGAVDDVLEHSILSDKDYFAMTPEVHPVRGGGGSYNRAYNPAAGGETDRITIGVDVDDDEFLDIMLHEMEHQVQQEAGFAKGGSWKEFNLVESMREANNTWDMGKALTDLSEGDVGKLLQAANKDASVIMDIKRMYPEEYGKINDALNQFGLTSIDDLAAKGAELKRWSAHLTPEGKYHRLAGEVEARNVEGRRTMTPDERRFRPPYMTEDVPVEDQLIKMTLGDEAMAPARYPKQPRMSREDAVAAGYWHPVGGGKKLPIPFEQLTREISPAHDLVPWKPVNWEELQGGTLIPALGDRTEAGQWLHSVGGYRLSDDVLLEGGHDFMRSHDPYGAIWASDKGAARVLHNKALSVLEQGGDPYLAFMPMGHGATNFNTMMSDALLGQMQEEIKTGQISKTAKNMFDREMRKLRPEWKGIEHPDSMRMLDDNGALRHVFVQTIQKDIYQKRGFPNVAETRFAITDPNLMDTPLLQGGQAIGRMTDEFIENPMMPHRTYNTQLGGQYMGGDVEGIPRELLFPEFTKARRAEGAPPGSDYRSFDLSRPVQLMDQEWLDNLMLYLSGRNR
jgi:hypothetical protein